MVNAITVNGQTMKVLNSWSAGPGGEPHTFQVAGAIVERIGSVWQMQRRGQFPVRVTVEVQP